MTRTFLALLHFDGSGFHGWQRQPARRTVQQDLESALERLAAAPTRAHAAGRTDAGVHALGLPVSFLMPDRWTAPAVHRALNAVLPPDIWVAEVHAMRDGFHARTRATGRRYRYDVGVTDAARSPFRRRWCWALAKPLDGSALADAAAALPGTHDCRAFAVTGQEKPHWRCTLREARWEAVDDGAAWRFHVAADRFLHHMVRLLVGTMVDIGLGRRPAADMTRLLGRIDNDETSPPAPAEGLFFVSADYPAEWYLGTAVAQAAEGVAHA
ncbi:MAG: tRNA pseudouridine(38-40) synthase TruA [Gemmatimonadales bacterium]|nr:tRNA pseudouridine(38-40) synthase TruA [Gemmatimonadales bacterium]